MGVTPRETAEDVVRCLLDRACLPRGAEDYLRGRVELAVAQALADELEACVAAVEHLKAQAATAEERRAYHNAIGSLKWRRGEESVGESEGDVGRSQGP